MNLEDWFYWGGLFLAVCGIAFRIFTGRRWSWAFGWCTGVTMVGIAALLSKLEPFTVASASACFLSALMVICVSTIEEREERKHGKSEVR